MLLAVVEALGWRKTLVYASLVLATVGCVTFAIGELATRILLPQDLTGPWQIQSERGYSYLRADGRARHQYADRVVYYRFNDLHLRGGPLGSGERVLVLGDSFTFGWLVAEEDSFVGILAANAEREFGSERYEFLNAANGGWGTADYLAYLEDRGPVLDPDIVLVFHGFDDVDRAMNSGLYTVGDRGELMARVVAPPGGWKALLNALPGYRFLLEHSHLAALARNVVLRSIWPKGGVRAEGLGPKGVEKTKAPLDPRAFPLMRGLFRELETWCKNHDAQLLVATYGFHRWYREVLTTNDREFYAQAEPFFAEQRIPFFDVVEDVSAAAPGYEGFITADGVHPNEAGHRLIAESVWKWLGPELRRHASGS